MENQLDKKVESKMEAVALQRFKALHDLSILEHQNFQGILYLGSCMILRRILRRGY